MDSHAWEEQRKYIPVMWMSNAPLMASGPNGVTGVPVQSAVEEEYNIVIAPAKHLALEESSAQDNLTKAKVVDRMLALALASGLNGPTGVHARCHVGMALDQGIDLVIMEIIAKDQPLRNLTATTDPAFQLVESGDNGASGLAAQFLVGTEIGFVIGTAIPLQLVSPAKANPLRVIPVLRDNAELMVSGVNGVLGDFVA
eukprot:TRINITY_DN6464_c0_g1_i1.p2 TRINITY_DN6464_c0_g1~~TRINITY_DN6464_c0_g1_i1.p2  ORF type:complete len:199 (+),score=16.83 TRINITY_DN6464_c0_g1_i1:3-599(+)